MIRLPDEYKDIKKVVVDTVNVASRLEKANKEFGTDICFSHEIYINLKKDLHENASLAGEIKLKGRSSPSKVYSI